MSAMAIPAQVERAAALRTYLAERLANDLSAFTKKAFQILLSRSEACVVSPLRFALRIPAVGEAAANTAPDDQHSSENFKIDSRHDCVPSMGLAHRTRAQFLNRVVLAGSKYRTFGFPAQSLAKRVVSAAVGRQDSPCRGSQSSIAVHEQQARTDDRNLSRRNCHGTGM